MKKLIPILFVTICFNSSAQTPSNYDRIKQDPKIANSDLKIVTIQNDIASIKLDNTQMKKDIAQLKLENAELKKRLDSIKAVTILYDKSTELIVSQNIKDTITIYKIPSIK